MFHSTVIVIFITRGILHATTVRKGRRDIVKTVRYEWTSHTLPQIFAAIKNLVGHQPIRVLLANELSYLLELAIPPSITALEERAHIREQLAVHIPEVLHMHDWDYKEIPSKTRERRVLIFAPVKFVYDSLVKASTETGVTIEAIEPVALASRRHNNPVIGTALKQDIKGKDAQVLNVVPNDYREEDIPSKEAGDETSSTWLMLILVLIIVLVPAGGAWYYFNRAPTKTNQEIPEPDVTVETTPSPDPSPTITADPTPNLSHVSIRVLNGTGQPGLSAQIKSLLEQKGFQDITTGNADSTDFSTTIIRKKDSVPVYIHTQLAAILNGYTLEESDPLTDELGYDVLIIVGERNE